MLKIKDIWLFILLGVVSLGIACDAGQTDEANRIISEANAIITKNNSMVNKANALTTELLGVSSLPKVEDFEKYKTDNKAKFDELQKLNDDLEKGCNEAAAKFEQVTKMKVDDKFKEYNSLMSQEMKKRGEIAKEDAVFVKSFLAEKDGEKIDTLITESNKRSEDLKKTADEIKAKSDKIVKENPSVFN